MVYFIRIKGVYSMKTFLEVKKELSENLYRIGQNIKLAREIALKNSFYITAYLMLYSYPTFTDTLRAQLRHTVTFIYRIPPPNIEGLFTYENVDVLSIEGIYRVRGELIVIVQLAPYSDLGGHPDNYAAAYTKTEITVSDSLEKMPVKFYILADEFQEGAFFVKSKLYEGHGILAYYDVSAINAPLIPVKSCNDIPEFTQSKNKIIDDFLFAGNAYGFYNLQESKFEVPKLFIGRLFNEDNKQFRTSKINPYFEKNNITVNVQDRNSNVVWANLNLQAAYVGEKIILPKLNAFINYLSNLIGLSADLLEAPLERACQYAKDVVDNTPSYRSYDYAMNNRQCNTQRFFYQAHTTQANYPAIAPPNPNLQLK